MTTYTQTSKLARRLAIAQAGITMLSLFALSIPSAAFAEQGDQGDDGEHIVNVQTHHDDDNDDNEEDDDNDDHDGPSANLIVKKVVVGGQLTASAFSFTYDKQGNEPGVTQQFNSNGENDLTVAPGAYDITEVPVANYTPSYTSNQEGHPNDCNNLSAGNDQNEGKHGPVICTITNTYQAPETPQSCTLVSDATTNVGVNPAVLSFVHGNWTHGLDASGAKWIWNAFHATPSQTVDEVVTFTKTFNVVDTPSSVSLDLASDNTYTVAVNGTPSCSDTVNLDNFSNVEPTCDITSLVHTGVNTLTFVVTNTHGFGTNPEENPGGLIYKVSITGASCAPVPPPTANSCVVPVTPEGAEHVTIGASNSPGEKSVQQVLTDAGYVLNADTGQSGTQSWTGTGNTVHFEAKNLSKNAGHNHVFGYVANGGAFVGVFRDGNVTNPLYSGLPLKNPGNSAVSFDVNGLNDVVFAIYDDSSNTYFYTKKTSNGDSLAHTAVYNPESNTYIIGFEDITGGGDSDMNDLVVKLSVTGCNGNEENPTTATITAYKVICDDEKDLPNWGDGSGPALITATTAADWVAGHKSCHLAPWDFQWAAGGASNPGDNVTGTPSGWNSFATGVATAIPASARAWVRENIDTSYIPFVGLNTESNVSAEMYCNDDILNYDNYDYISPVTAGASYYCVGFNSPKVVPPNTGILKIVKHTVGGNDSFTFNVSGQSPVVVPTAANQGLSSDLVLTAGEYDVSEATQSGWSFTSATCSDANLDTIVTQSNISNGKHITLPAGHTITCYFDNNKVAIDNPPTFTTTSTGGGRSGSNHRGGGGGNGGRVAGASTTNTSCIPPITMYMKYGWKNDVSQVKALQSFLNDYMHTSLTVNGVFGKDTFAAVKAFQKQEGEKVLNPWVGLPASGIKSKDTPTGYVYQTTKWHINNIVCPGSEEFPAKLI